MEGCRPVEVLWCSRRRLSLGQPTTCLALSGQRDEGIAEGLGLPGHRFYGPFPVVDFVGVESLLDVGGPMLQQALDQSSQLVRRGRDGLGGTESRCHPSKEGPQGTLRVV